MTWRSWEMGWIRSFLWLWLSVTICDCTCWFRFLQVWATRSRSNCIADIAALLHLLTTNLRDLAIFPKINDWSNQVRVEMFSAYDCWTPPWSPDPSLFLTPAPVQRFKMTSSLSLLSTSHFLAPTAQVESLSLILVNPIKPPAAMTLDTPQAPATKPPWLPAPAFEGLRPVNETLGEPGACDLGSLDRSS